MFEQWIEDQNEQHLFSRNQSILVGSFFNPEAAKKMLGVGSTNVESSEEEFEASWKMVENQQLPKRRRRRVTNG